jgi:protein ImuB
MNLPATLYACLYVREFPAQAMLRLRPQLKQSPAVVLDGTPPRQWVCSLNARAHTLGIEAGTTRAELEVFPSVAILPRSLAEESSARAALLECADQFSPRVELMPPDESNDTHFCAILDIAGTEKLIGPPEKLSKKLLHAVRVLSIHASIVASTNIDAAISLARSMPVRTAIIPAGEEAKTLAPLPLSVLPLTTDHAETLTRWGIATLGALAALPEKELIARLGQEGRRLRQLARGQAPHLLVPAPPAFALEERIELDSPVELLDSLLFVLGVLLDHIIARATAQILALASVTVTLALEGGSTHTRPHTRTVRPALPNNDRSLWLKLLHLDLQAHPPPAAILFVTLTADPGSTSKIQLGLFSPQLPEPDRLDVTLARIRAIVGPQDSDTRVGRAVLEDTHRPDSFRMEPFALPATSSTVPTPQAQSRSAHRRLRPPEPLTVTLHQRRPTSFVFRNKRYTVERSWGPWFFSGNWWGVECWSMQKWDLVARCPEDNTMICCCLARHPVRNDWHVEELYD